MGDVIGFKGKSFTAVPPTRSEPLNAGLVFEAYDEGDFAIVRQCTNGDRPVLVDPYLYFESADQFDAFVDFVLGIRESYKK